MKFLDQLKLLVWKNFTLRKRQHLRNLVEIVWPLVLFIILVAIRNRKNYGATNMPDSIYRPRALPSAGFFPFARSFLCDFKNTKTNDPDELLNGLPNLRSSSLGRLIEDALPLMANSTVRERILRINSDRSNFERDYQAWSDLVRSRQLQWRGYNLSAVPLDQLLKDPAEFQEFLYNKTNLSPRVISELLSSTVNVQKIAEFAQPYMMSTSDSLSWPPQNPLSYFPFLSSGESQQRNLLWALLLWRIEDSLRSEGRVSGSLVRQVICDAQSPVNLGEILSGPGNVTEVKMALCKLNNTVLGELGSELQTQIKVPNVTDLQSYRGNLTDVLNSLTNDYRNIAEDVQALESLSQVSRDYFYLMQEFNDRDNGGGFRETLCGNGRSLPEDDGTGSGGGSNGSQGQGWQQAPLGLLAAACGQDLPNGTFDDVPPGVNPIDYYLNMTQNMNLARYDDDEEENAKRKADEKSCSNLTSVYDKYNVTGDKDSCTVIDPKWRVDCGWPGISAEQCKRRGCCFDSSKPGTRFCFYKAEDAGCNCYLNQFVRSVGGVTGNAGQGDRDTGFVQFSSLFLKGKILYTPDNNVTRYIIQQIKNELSDITRIRDFASWWVNNSDYIHKSVLNYTNLLKRPLDSRICELSNVLRTGANPDWSEVSLNLLNSSARRNITIIPESFNVTTVLNSLDQLFGTILRVFKCASHEYFEGYKDEDSLVKRAINTSEVPAIASLVFEDSVGDLDNVPKFIKYKIRQDVDYTPATNRIRRWYWRPGPQDSFFKQRYFNFGFLYLQDLIDRALMNILLNETIEEPGVYMQEFPYPCYVKDKFVFYIGGTMPLFMTLAWIFSVAMIIRGVVHEKERRLKEVMKVMGLGNGVHWVAWFINSSILMVITIALLVAVLKGGKILWHSNPVVIFLFLFVFMIATIMMCFLISVFFARANLAAACGGIIFFVTYLPYVVVRWFEQYMTTGQKAIASLLSTTSFGVCCNYLARYEEQGVGAQWSNFFSSPVSGDGFSLGYAICMMMIDAVIYGILTWYIEAILPGQYGIPRPWYFPFQKSYWFEVANKKVLEVDASGTQRVTSRSESRGAVSYRSDSGGMDEVAFQDEDRCSVTEKEPTQLPLGCSIKNLVKIYKDGNKVAVDGLSLNLYQGQITSFLGHNGAGKTTTMSVLTGLFPPTSGTAIVNGYDIRKDIDLVRKSLGICPQYNVLFDNLTVSEHLWFYASLKGMPKEDIPAEVERFLKDVGLEDKRHELSSCLSGGMKRKLSVAMAFVAGSKVVILDEPTAGVDPYARRGIWDLLLYYKTGRTVLLSTHHMDEADILGDRIAIISQGKLQCCGSSLFLKGHYGNGYYMTLTKKAPEERPGTARTLKDVTLMGSGPSTGSSLDEGVGMDSLDASEQGSLNSVPAKSSSDPSLHVTEVFCKESAVTSFVKAYIPSAELIEDIGSELTYVLPTELAGEGRFQDLFEELDRNLDKLHIGSYGVSDTTLEEVFLKVAEEANAEEEDMLAAEMPKRRPSFRTQLSRSSRISDSYNDREQLLADDSLESNEDDTPSVLDALDGVYDGEKRLTGVKLLKGQFWALLVKRFHHTRRNRKGFVSQILLPAFFVCLAMLVSQIRPVSEMPALELNTDMFLDLDPHEHYLAFALDDNGKSVLTQNMMDMLVQYPGVGTSCLENSCKRKPIKFSPAPKENVSTLQCDCRSTGTAKCPAGAGGPRPSQWQSFTGDRLQNLTGRNMTDYLLKTYHNFIRKRYGAVTLGDNFRNLPSSFSQSNVSYLSGIFKQRNAKAWYNTKGYHAAPTFLNILNNVILRGKAREKGLNASLFGINTFNHPMNYTKEQLSEENLFNRIVDVLVAICVVFALSFVPASFVVYLVNERACKAKHLHLVSGVRPFIYWLASYVWDLFNYLIPAVCCIFIFLAFGEDSYTSSSNFAPTFLLLILYGWAITPLMYPASFLFKESSTAYIVLICVNIFIGINTTLATFILEFFVDDKELIAVVEMLKKIFLIFPNFCLGRGLIDLARNQFMDVFERFGQNLVRDPFSWDITGRNIMMLIIQGFVFFFFTVLIEYRFFLPKRRVDVTLKPLENEDEDVEKERERIERGEGTDDILRLKNLTKVYKTRRMRNVAVNRLCVGVPKGECFGLLGVNGAGKTSTFKMLTGDISVTSGEAFVDGYSVLTDIHNAHQSMGYCPQFDGLDSKLTAVEHLRLYARLRGVPEKDVKQVVESLIARMNLTEYANRCAGGYSGGNKRKLSTAIALVGNPPIVFLDEPTTGMDPKARRFLWNVITSLVKEGRTVILTSHSMEECEALCSRVAIMVNGQFKCLGSPQHLKNKYGDGYTVTLRIGGENPNLEAVSEFIKSLFPSAVLKDQHHNQLQYQFPSQGLVLSKVFGHIEANRKIFDIEDYSVSQTTLDQVFINFAKNQTDGEENEDVASYPREFAISEPPYRDEDAGPRASFVRLSDYPRFGDVEV
ncbi:ATP-binding cassette sub-family A member 1-like isoform X2 [Pocillopora damicornis]|uniref:ATP-binding cassette sub-family A member 1-like isoform X2 n=1 Tax=Pocillopora damicornis TaxID=46731 RepID=UPI000F552F53|nr:ATP-binding cassette sub-family A member 1-like isoform X2 [Pocillopora damicornis]